MAKEFMRLGETYLEIRKTLSSVKNVVTEQVDLGPGFESDALLNKVLTDFNIDTKNKTKVIEFLISLSNKTKNIDTSKAAVSTPTQGTSTSVNSIQTIAPKPTPNTANYLPKQ